MPSARGEHDPHLEPSRRGCLRGHDGAVRVRDRPDDGQPEAVSLGVPDAFGAQPLEGHEQPIDLAGRNHRPGIADLDPGAVIGLRRRDVHAPAGNVVPDRVVDQVGDQALHQAWVA